MIKFFQNIYTSISRCVFFVGKATFCEFWSFVTFNIIIFLILYFLNTIYVIRYEIYFFIMIVPFYAVLSRRMQDVGIWGSVVFVPYIILGIHLLIVEKFASRSDWGAFGQIIILFFILNILLLIIALLPSKTNSEVENKTAIKEEIKSDDTPQNL